MTQQHADAAYTRELIIKVSVNLFRALLLLLVFGGFATLLIQINALPKLFAYWSGSDVVPGPSGSVALPSVLVCGIIGGFVSLQRRLKDLTVQDLELLANSKVYLILAPMVGGVLAMVLYLIFLAGLLRGDMFPEFVSLSTDKTTGFPTIFEQYGKHGFSDYAKLLVWAFIAGFSEKFVTNVLGRFEGAAVATIPKNDEASNQVANTENQDEIDGESETETPTQTQDMKTP
ncbi:MAG: hypothetical protein ABJE63_10835 [Lentilitoribacter sp.]